MAHTVSTTITPHPTIPKCTTEIVLGAELTDPFTKACEIRNASAQLNEDWITWMGLSDFVRLKPIDWAPPMSVPPSRPPTSKPQIEFRAPALNAAAIIPITAPTEVRTNRLQ